MCSKAVYFVVLALAVGMVCSSALAEMVAYYPFNEGQGTTTADATGNGNDGTFNADVAWVAGQKGWGVGFDTAGERILIGPIDPSASNNAMTLAAWINWEGSGHSIAQQGIIGKRLGWDPGTGVKWFWQTNPAGDFLFRADSANGGGGGGLGWGNALLVPYANEWTHVAVTWEDDATIQYINGEEVSTGNITFIDTADDTPVVIGCVDSTNTESFVGLIDEVRIYDTALAASEIQRAMLGDFNSSSAPAPSDAAVDVPRDVILGWAAGDFADTHDVYFGTSYAEVDAASRANPSGLLISQGQKALTYELPDLLDFNTTYYWRVDEVNALPDGTIFKGSVWSFTAEPFSYAITSIKATASSSHAADMGPEKTIDGSGLDAADLHSIIGTDMWLSGGSDAGPIWLQYEFDQAYQLQEMWVWNSNQAIETFVGFGIKDVTVEYSIDGVAWTVLEGISEFARASGASGYAHNTTVDFGGATAKYVKLTVGDNWGVLAQSGLSEVRFYYVPSKARAPYPAAGQAGVGLDPTLSWRVGRQAAAHEVYFSTDRAAVADGTALLDTVTERRYALSGLEYGRMYYWRVNEVNDAADPVSVAGNIWSFSTTEHAAVEDMESYTDDLDAGQAIFQTWIDGWDNGSGATVGYFQAPFAEQTVVNGGRQSLPLDYNNVNSPWYSETERVWDAPQNWTASGADTLTVHFRGNAPGFVETTPDQFTMGAAGADIWNNSDEFRFAYKRLNGNGTIIAQVESLVNTNDWAKAGVMIRESLNGGSKFAGVYVTPANGCSFQGRLLTDDLAVSDTDVVTAEQTAITAPYWVKLERTGNTFNGYYSADGAAWTAMSWNPQTIDMIANVYVGLALTSHAAGVSTTAEFSGISTTGNVSGSWQPLAIGVEQPANDPGPLYVALEDSAGHLKVITHPDENATLASQWQAWTIPLSDFTGVSASKIERMIIGVGDRDNPTPGGAGLLYIDDIWIGHRGLADPGLSGLVAYYALENDANDSSGNGHDGTPVGDPLYVDGPAGHGMALEFDGAGGQYVDLGTFNPSAATGQMTVALWAKWNGLSGFYQGLVAKRDTWAADDMMWQIEANIDNGSLGFFREGSAPADGDPVLPVGQWTHVAATFDGTTVRFYINGEVTGQGDFSFGSDLEAALVFGACQGNGENPFNGVLDEVMLYDRALSPFEMRYLADTE